MTRTWTYRRSVRGAVERVDVGVEVLAHRQHLVDAERPLKGDPDGVHGTGRAEWPVMGAGCGRAAAWADGLFGAWRRPVPVPTPPTSGCLIPNRSGTSYKQPRPEAGATLSVPAGWRAPDSAVFTGHTQWGEGHRDARGAPRGWPHGGEYDVARAHSPETVRVRVCRDQPQLEDSGAGRRGAWTLPCASLSRSILLYLAERQGLPARGPPRHRALNWLMAGGQHALPRGGFGHFYKYAPEKLRYLHRPVRDRGEAPARRADRHLSTPATSRR